VLGISIDEPEAALRLTVAEYASQAAERLNEQVRLVSDDILINDDYLGEGYGILGAPEQEAIRLFARCEGVLLDPVYTGRAAAGMIDLIRKGFFAPGDGIVFWHTGGTPALFASRYAPNLVTG
jgi:1-aminocyclopropane-1-carboxylate deaminase/D-cysteine desulfhydrase-like pyridoxal-dependent ACC family enzyme